MSDSTRESGASERAGVEAWRENAVGIVRLAAEKRSNPLSRTLIAALVDAVARHERDPAVAAIVLTGNNRYFSVGADIAEFAEEDALTRIERGWLDDLDRLRASSKPLIAAVEGHAVGGGFELALLADLIVAGEGARFALPETGIGAIAGNGGTQRLVALCGRAIATDLILTGRTLDAAEALAFGITARTCADGQALPEAVSLGRAIAARDPLAVRFAREVIREATETPMHQSLRIERLLAALTLDSEGSRRRVAAFLGRRRGA